MSETYEVRYLVVAGIAWIRHTLPGPAVWLALFDDGPPRAWKEPVETLPRQLEAGSVAGVDWSLEVEPLAPPHRVPPRAMRPFAKTQYELVPAVRVSGRIGDRVLNGVPGHSGHVWGTRHAERWIWCHASLDDGRWADVLRAKVAGLPEIGLWATQDERGFGSGGFELSAAPSTAVGVTYRDPDGSRAYCWHSERGRLAGRGIETDVAAYEFGSRETLDGWPTVLL